jgi:hypothetical protein
LVDSKAVTIDSLKQYVATIIIVELRSKETSTVTITSTEATTATKTSSHEGKEHNPNSPTTVVTKAIVIVHKRKY